MCRALHVTVVVVVFAGKVQGVFFRKHAHAAASQLKLLGWVANTKQQTVVGEAVGSKEAIDKL